MSTTATERASRTASIQRLESQAAASDRTARAAKDAQLALEQLLLETPRSNMQAVGYLKDLIARAGADCMEYKIDAADRRTQAEHLRTAR